MSYFLFLLHPLRLNSNGLKLSTKQSRLGLRLPQNYMSHTELVSDNPGPVVFSNQATKRTVHFYRDPGHNIITLDAPRRISCNGNREAAREVLATRNL